jgi:4-aminobutyrate aminotransferase/(S)-3-amino-2-methylpropionate transaminase
MSTRNFVKVSDDLPGPKARKLLERRNEAVPRGVGYTYPLFVEKASGALVQDVDGNVFLDFAGAIGSINAGHSAPEVVSAVKNQLDKFIHTCFHVGMYEPYVALAEKLADITPGTFPKKTILLNSGAEAVENAVKIARKYTGKTGIVSFVRGFHGRTLLGMSLTSKVKPYKFKMGPFAPAIYKAVYPDFLSRPATMTAEQYAEHCVREFERLLLTEAAPEEIAAVIMEPVQGEGGFNIPPKSFVQGVYEICRKHGILFIADEIQTGFGRTGAMFASELFGIEPDLITLSKSLAAGVPISAVVGRREIMDTPDPGELGGTYGGSPLGCAAALAVIEKMEAEGLPARANEMGAGIVRFFEQLRRQYPIIADVRGLGAMCAIELVDPATGEPAKAFAGDVIQRAYRKGVMLLGAGVHSNIIRFLAPLVMAPEQLREGLEIIGEAIAEAAAARSQEEMDREKLKS